MEIFHFIKWSSNCLHFKYYFLSFVEIYSNKFITKLQVIFYEVLRLIFISFIVVEFEFEALNFKVCIFLLSKTIKNRKKA